MCGIFGMFSPSGRALRHPQLLGPMGDLLEHRGPDGVRSLVSPHVAIGCRRLRVVDLRKEADQPFEAPDNQCWISCNGEIYNHRALRARFADYPFHSLCDVEVILPLFLERAMTGLADLDGMFGLAVWDGATDSLILARDRAGEKPLFYARVGEEIWFASEIQALLVGGILSTDLNEGALHWYLSLGYVPEPHTLMSGIRKIPAGAAVRFRGGEQETVRYWRPEEMAAAPDERPTISSLQEALEVAVRAQMKADVPVGVFLSGGLDSALLATLAAAEAPGRLHTFNARFADSSYDESDWAAKCAALIGSDHHEVRIDDGSLMEALEAIVEGVAEPVSDPAVLPTYLLARRARQDVTVVLSGEGADELFGGYPTYPGHRLAAGLSWAGPLLEPLRWGLSKLPESRQKVPLTFLLSKLLSSLGKDAFDRHRAWFGLGAEVAYAGGSSVRPAFPEETTASLPAGLAGLMLLDYLTYLREGLLPKIDRSTMLNSLEARAPYLDRALAELAWSLPENARVRGLSTKSLLKKATLRWLPASFVYRRKRGLSVPLAPLIDGALGAEVDRLLDPRRLGRQEILDAGTVSRLLVEHRSGKRNHMRSLWALVMFQYWLERWLPARA